jgi:hypothetical protein
VNEQLQLHQSARMRDLFGQVKFESKEEFEKDEDFITED